jgi:hypothetical protein
MSDSATGVDEGRFTGIFLSGVTSEFAGARDELAKDLRKVCGLKVWVQEEFPPVSNEKTVLQRLDEFIEECHSVYCIVGQRSGAIPEKDEAKEFSWRLPEALKKASYTQWEYILANAHKKEVVVFRALDDFKPHKKKPEKDDQPKLQSKFLKVYFSTGSLWNGFSNVDGLGRMASLYREEVARATTGGKRATGTTEGLDVSEQAGPKVDRKPRKAPGDADATPVFGRDEEIVRVCKEIGRQREHHDKVVMLIGSDGIGKKSLWNAVLRQEGEGFAKFEDGLVRPDVHGVDNQGDFEQAIWDELFKARDTDYRPTSRNRAKDLRKIEALVFVPAVGPTVEFIPMVRDLMPKSVVCTWSAAPGPKLRGAKITLMNVTGEALTKIFAAEYEYNVPEESVDALAVILHAQSDGHPLEIAMLAEEARNESYHSDEDGQARLFMEWIRRHGDEIANPETQEESEVQVDAEARGG